MYVVTGVLALRRESLAGNVRLKLFACRLRLEKFAEHQLATAHSCIAITDTLHLLSYSTPHSA
jgi:hypothetical protein